MAYLSLYRKYRSQSFAEVSGQEHVTRTLGNAIASGRVGHAYLFCGPRGTGKTSIARLLAKCLNCAQSPTLEPCNECPSCREINAGITGASFNVQEFDAASKRSIDDIRHLRETIGTGQWGAGDGKKGRKVVIIDEVHMLTTEAFNALLKTLEEPPEHVLFVLATTDVHKVPATIVSRCQRFDFRRGSREQIQDRLRFVAEQEGVEVEEEALDRVARSAGGSWRDALSLLEQVFAYGGERVTGADVTEVLGTVAEEQLAELAGAVAARDGAAVFAAVDGLIADGRDIRQIARDLTEYLRQLLLVAVGAVARTSAAEEQVRLAAAFGIPRLVSALDLLSATEREFRESDQLRLILEVALIRLAHLEGSEPSTRGTQPDASMPNGKGLATEDTEGTERGAGRVQKRSEAREEIPAHPPKASVSGPLSVPPVTSVANPPVEVQSANAEPAAEADVDLETIRRKWNVVVQELTRRKRRSTAELVREAQPARLDGTTLVLSFEYETHVHLIERPEDRKHLEGVLADLFGARLRVAAQVDKAVAAAEIVPRQATPKPAPLDRGAAPTGNGAAADNLRLVHEVIEIFEGKILEDEA